MTRTTRNAATIEQKLNWMRANWPQENLDAAELVLRIYRARDLLLGRCRGILDVSGLTHAEFESLAVLRQSPPPHEMTPGELSQSVWITTGGMAKALRKLEESGYISRTVSDADRRSRRVRLTDKGRERVEASMQDLLESHEASLTQALSGKERKTLIGLLSKVLDTLEPAP